MSPPPALPVYLSGELQTFLSKVDRALGCLDGSIMNLPSTDLFVAMYVRKEAGLLKKGNVPGPDATIEPVTDPAI